MMIDAKKTIEKVGIILAAGYGTRLAPLTDTLPKPLLPINGKPMIDYIVSSLQAVGVTKIIVVSNGKYFATFSEWASLKKNIAICNDKTTTNEMRLGGVVDLLFAVQEHTIDNDIILVGGDNIAKFSFESAVKKMEQTNAPVIIAHDVKSLDLAKKYGTVILGENNVVLGFEEKPKNPKTSLIGICSYCIPAHSLRLLPQYVREGNPCEGPAYFFEWLARKDKGYAVIETEPWFDVGSFESLASAKNAFGEKNVTVENLKRE
jgi:glucose-1-phosphate thymidylyltransferase